MNLLKFPHTKNNKYSYAIQKREMSIENTINKFRFVLIVFIILGDMFAFKVKNLEAISVKSDFIIGFLMILSIILIMIIINKLTKTGKYYSWLKYFSTFVDLSICFFLSLVYSDSQVETFFSSGDIAVIFTLLLVTFNVLSTLRVCRNVILFSCALTSFYIIIFLSMLDLSDITIIYSLILLLFLSSVNIWLAKSVSKSLILQIDMQELNEEIRTQKEELEYKNKNHTASVSYASRIQQALLPHHESISSQIPENFILFKPKDIVSGDFFWFKDFDNYWVFAVADCTGHGVPGAFMSVMGISFLNEIIQNQNMQSPAEILNVLREKVKTSFLNKPSGKQRIRDGMDIALCLYDKRNRAIHFSGAYNPLLIVRNNELIELKPDRQPVGSYIKEKPFKSEKINALEGDCIYMYSDGFADQIGGMHGKKYLSKNFKEIITRNHNKSFEIQKEILEKEFDSWKSSNIQIDDVLVVGLKL